MKQERETVAQIQRFSKKGLGIGVSEEFKKHLEVRFVYPSETVKVKVFKCKQGLHQAKAIEVLNRHPDRENGKCAHFEVCGGCSWQSLSYKAQLEYKDQIIQNLFEPFASLDLIHPIIPSDKIWNFRNKMEFTFFQTRDNQKSLGLIEAGSKGRVVNLDECHLCQEWMMNVLKGVKEFWDQSQVQAYHRLAKTGTLHTLTLREGMNTGEKMVILTVCGEPSSLFSHKELKAFEEAVLSKEPAITSIFLQIKRIQEGVETSFSEMLLYGKDHINEKLTIAYPNGDTKEFVFKISPSSFFQPNTSQAEKIFSLALKYACSKAPLRVLDLFCGTATFSLVFSSLVKEVIGVEINPYAVFDAEVNLEVNGVKNANILRKDVADFVKEAQSFGVFDLVIIDPPRSGLGAKVTEKIVAIKPKSVLYVSCNPQTQVQDIMLFKEAGYEIEVIQPIDQFPHTIHMENIILLTKSC